MYFQKPRTFKTPAYFCNQMRMIIANFDIIFIFYKY